MLNSEDFKIYSKKFGVFNLHKNNLYNCIYFNLGIISFKSNKNN